MNQYLTVEQVAEHWDVSKRRVQILCRDGRISGVTKQSGVWLIPRNSFKPVERKPGKQIKSLNLLSLFSGCGGMDLGFEGGFQTLKKSVNPQINANWEYKKKDNEWVDLGETIFKTIFANDIVEDAKVTWSSYFENKRIDGRSYCLDSIVDLVKLHQENQIQIFPQNVDILTGGFPCQDFSIAGNRNGFQSTKNHMGKNDINVPTEENRGQLYIWMREVIAITQPKMFVAENVKGLINLSDVKTTIEQDFASISNGGYLVVPGKVLHAADFGVPQNRERIIFYGFKKSALTPHALEALSSKNIPANFNPYPLPTHTYTFKSKGRELPFVTVKDALLGLEEPLLSTDLSQRKYSKAKYMGAHCQGQTEVDLEGIAPTIRSEHHGNIEFRRLSKKNGGRHNNELKRGLVERRLTVRECARLQTFPDDYDFVLSAKEGRKSVSASSAYKLIGNAVPPLLAYHIAKRLEDNWDLYFNQF